MSGALGTERARPVDRTPRRHNRGVESPRLKRSGQRRRRGMVRTVTAREAEVGFRDVLDRLLADGEPVVVEDAGEALAVVISPAEYRASRRSRDP